MISYWSILPTSSSYINFDYFDIFITPAYTVNGEKFAGLNFRVFRGFQGYCKRFSVNIIQASYVGVV